jgi:hypothetical protein
MRRACQCHGLARGVTLCARRSQQQLATWGIRALAALGVASRSSERFAAQSKAPKPQLGDVLARLLSLHIGARCRCACAACAQSDLSSFPLRSAARYPRRFG